MKSVKFIKLFEEFTKAGKLTWSDIRDSIQMKRPFMIVVFKNKDNYLTAVNSDLSEYDKVYQTSVASYNGKTVKYPSTFIILSQDTDMTSEIRQLFEKYEIRQIIYSKANSEFSNLYSPDGSSSEYGNEIVSSTDPSEFSTEDYFKIDSTVYRFIGFN